MYESVPRSNKPYLMNVTEEVTIHRRVYEL